ncbi:hypothetical protein [Nocardia sp. NPDC059228]
MLRRYAQRSTLVPNLLDPGHPGLRPLDPAGAPDEINVAILAFLDKVG